MYASELREKLDLKKLRREELLHARLSEPNITSTRVVWGDII